MLADHLHGFFTDQAGSSAGFWVYVVVEAFHGGREAFVGFLVQVGDCDAGGELGVVWVNGAHAGRRLGGEVVEFNGGNAVV